MPRTSLKKCPAVKGPLSLEELSPFQLGEHLATVEDVYKEPNVLGRDLTNRCFQPHTHNYATSTNYRLGWDWRSGELTVYSHAEPADTALARKIPEVVRAARSVAFMVKMMKVYPKDVQETCMYVFTRATVYTHWRFLPESQWSAWIQPTRLPDNDWYFFGTYPGMELQLLAQLRKGYVNLRDALYVPI